MSESSKIDVVIAWVDGADPAHIEKRFKYQESSPNAHELGLRQTRFADRGEIYYCIASVLKYAPFVNRIWIVTDNQRPKFIESFSKAGLCSDDFIQIVDHRDIFAGYEHVLPTFNSITIETMLWRIPGLAENFVYFNDDFFINRPLQTIDWFQAGKPVLHGIWKRPESKRFNAFLRKITFRWPRPKPSFYFSQELAANLAGIFDDFMQIGHHPHPMRRSILEEFYSNNQGILRSQINYRFRNSRQHCTMALANHLEITRSKLKFEEPASVAYMEPGISHLETAAEDISHGRKNYGCIQNLDEYDDFVQEQIRTIMKKKFGAFLPKKISL